METTYRRRINVSTSVKGIKTFGYSANSEERVNGNTK